jgi:hypothetical protein
METGTSKTPSDLAGRGGGFTWRTTVQRRFLTAARHIREKRLELDERQTSLTGLR